MNPSKGAVSLKQKEVICSQVICIDVELTTYQRHYDVSKVEGRRLPSPTQYLQERPLYIGWKHAKKRWDIKMFVSCTWRENGTQLMVCGTIDCQVNQDFILTFISSKQLNVGMQSRLRISLHRFAVPTMLSMRGSESQKGCSSLSLEGHR